MKTHLFQRAAALLMALALTLALAACGSGNKETTKATEAETTKATEAPTTEEATTEPVPSDVGYYELTEIPGEEGAAMMALMKALGLRAFIVLEEGGTGFMNMFGEEVEVLWADGALSAEGAEEKLPYTIEDGNFVLEQEGEKMIFTRGADEDAPKRGEYTGISGGGEAKLTRIDEIIFTETVLLEADEFTITATEIVPEDDWGDYVVKLLLENKTEDKSLRFAVDTASINGVTIDPYFSETIGAGESSEATLDFTLTSLLMEGVGDPTVIQIAWKVSDADDWFADPVAEETAAIYPLGENKAEIFVREMQEEDIVLADTDEVTVIVTGTDPDSFWGYELSLYLFNKTDTELYVSVDDAAVNDFEIDPYFGATVAPGCCRITSITFSNDKLQEGNIETVEKIEFTLIVREYDSWGDDDLFNEKVTLNP